jgi:hypothetical protein
MATALPLIDNSQKTQLDFHAHWNDWSCRHWHAGKRYS